MSSKNFELLERKIHETVHYIIGLKKENAALRKENDRLCASYKGYEQRINTLETTVKKLREEHNMVEQEILHALEQLETLEDSLSASEDTKDIAASEISDDLPEDGEDTEDIAASEISDDLPEDGEDTEDIAASEISDDLPEDGENTEEISVSEISDELPEDSEDTEEISVSEISDDLPEDIKEDLNTTEQYEKPYDSDQDPEKKEFRSPLPRTDWYNEEQTYESSTQDIDEIDEFDEMDDLDAMDDTMEDLSSPQSFSSPAKSRTWNLNPDTTEEIDIAEVPEEPEMF